MNARALASTHFPSLLHSQVQKQNDRVNTPQNRPTGLLLRCSNHAAAATAGEDDWRAGALAAAAQAVRMLGCNKYALWAGMAVVVHYARRTTTIVHPTERYSWWPWWGWRWSLAPR